MRDKNEAKLRKQNLVEWLKSDQEKRIGKSTGIKRYQIQEYREAYNSGGYYDQDFPEKIISTSKWYDSQEEVQEALDNTEPDKPEYKLRIRSQTLYRKHVPEHYEERWV